MLRVSIRIAIKAGGVPGLLRVSIRIAIKAAGVPRLLRIGIRIAIRATGVPGLLRIGIRIAIKAAGVPGLLRIGIRVPIRTRGLLRNPRCVRGRRSGGTLALRRPRIATRAAVGSADIPAAGLSGLCRGGCCRRCRVALRACLLACVFSAGAPGLARAGLTLTFGLFLALPLPLALAVDDGS